MMNSSPGELFDPGPDTAVHIRNLRVVRGRRVAVDDVSVTIPRGAITGLLGPSGCGKTTLMRSIVGTQVLTSGTVTVLGHPAAAVATASLMDCAAKKLVPADAVIMLNITGGGEARWQGRRWRRRG